MPFTIAIIGRPNVGKSTFFNRLVGKRLALVDDTPGVTRDRREAQGSLGPLQFRIIDTAGLEEDDESGLSSRMRAQTMRAIASSDIVFFMIDARAGVTPMDKYFADILRREPAPVLLLANKAEGRAGQPGLMEAFSLGLGDPIGISAEHGEGLGELFDAVEALVIERGLDLEEEKSATSVKTEEAGEEGVTASALPLQLAIIGRPNVGKSTLVNKLIGEERQITGPEAGLTRDTISIPWHYRGREVRLFDTAGLRRKSKVHHKLEKLSVADTMRAVNFAEVVVLVVDAENLMDKQDVQIASLIAQEGRALVIAVNKFDLVEDQTVALRLLNDTLERSLPQIRGVMIVPISALTGKGLDKLMAAVFKAFDYWNTRVSTGRLNRWLIETTERHPAPTAKGKRVKLRYISQVKARPPTFAIFVNRPADVQGSYLRYLENELRTSFKLPGVPLRILMRKGENPYD
jgi:GTP-binding protein